LNRNGLRERSPGAEDQKSDGDERLQSFG
jgi:hypothetical protein